MKNVINPAARYALRFNRTGYAFLLLGLLTFFCIHNLLLATGLMALSWACDPLNRQLHWAARPWWQKAWLTIHLLVLAGYVLFTFSH